jgi:ABC-type branched-subunit amino acid transport system permease subunit
MDFGVIFTNSANALLNAEALYLRLAAIGLNIHFGYTGLLNFGQVGFLAIAAYGLGVGVTYLDLPFFAAIGLGCCSRCCWRCCSASRRCACGPTTSPSSPSPPRRSSA